MIGFGQQTYVPDNNFEAYLEANGMGNGVPNDNYVTTANIDTITNLNIQNQSLSDLTGIEDFLALTYLNSSNIPWNQNWNQFTSLDVSNNLALTNLICSYNNLTSIDLSQNTVLTEFVCDENNLTSLDVSQNTALIYLECFESQLTSLDLSQNTALIFLGLQDNQLTSLDVSNNLALTFLDCSGNQLTNLDLRNGNNTNITLFTSINNPNLNCIDVDDPTWSTNNWTSIPSWSNFSNNCATAYGCTDSLACNYDSIATIDDLTCVYPTSNSTTAATCYTYSWDGTTYTTSGAYTNIYTNAVGCDSVHTLNLTINDSTTSTDNQVHCDSFTWIDGITYTSSNNTATWITTNAAGCDNVATLNLIINNSTTSIDYVGTHCDSYTWIDGLTYTASNDSATHMFQTVDGCDSLFTLYLTINYSPMTSSILGVNNVNFLQTESYSVGQNLNSTFTWYLNSGGIILNGINTNSVEVQWGNNSGIFELYAVETAQNGCSDTVFIDVNVATSTSIQEHATNKEILKVTDLLGRETKGNKNEVLFYIYTDGTVEKRIVIE